MKYDLFLKDFHKEMYHIDHIEQKISLSIRKYFPIPSTVSNLWMSNLNHNGDDSNQMLKNNFIQQSDATETSCRRILQFQDVLISFPARSMDACLH